MAAKPAKRMRDASLHSDDSDEGTDDWRPEQPYGSRPAVSQSGSNAASRRGAAPAPAASNQDRPAESTNRSIRLTVKAPPSRLREVTNSSSPPEPVNSRGVLSRNSKNKPPIVDEDSDIDDEEEEEEEIEEEDEQGEDEDGEGDEDDEEEEDDEEGEDEEDDDEDDDEDEDADGDTQMEDAAPAVPPRIKISAPAALRKPSPNRVLKQKNVVSVEEKEMQAADNGSDNEELSELDSQDEQDPMDEDDAMEDDDAGDVIAANQIGDDELDSDEDESGFGSRSGTPDLSKLTRRQRAHFEEGDSETGGPSGELMALSNEAQKKKFFTAEQITMRRAEMARRRKDLSEKRNEEEKADTLQRLLHKPAPKRRTKAQILADAEREEGGTPGSEEVRYEKANKLFARTIIGSKGTRIGLPEEWLGTPVGAIVDGQTAKHDSKMEPSYGRLIQVVE